MSNAVKPQKTVGIVPPSVRMNRKLAGKKQRSVTTSSGNGCGRFQKFANERVARQSATIIQNGQTLLTNSSTPLTRP